MEVSRSETLRDNERIKHAATAVTAWANALIFGAIGKMVLDKHLELLPSLGVIGAVVVLVLCSKSLTMLVAEGEI